MKTPEEFADEMRDVRDYPERLAPWRRRRAAISERDAEHAAALATVTAERDAARDALVVARKALADVKLGLTNHHESWWVAENALALIGPPTSQPAPDAEKP